MSGHSLTPCLLGKMELMYLCFLAVMLTCPGDVAVLFVSCRGCRESILHKGDLLLEVCMIFEEYYIYISI